MKFYAISSEGHGVRGVPWVSSSRWTWADGDAESQRPLIGENAGFECCTACPNPLRVRSGVQLALNFFGDKGSCWPDLLSASNTPLTKWMIASDALVQDLIELGIHFKFTIPIVLPESLPPRLTAVAPPVYKAIYPEAAADIDLGRSGFDHLKACPSCGAYWRTGFYPEDQLIPDDTTHTGAAVFSVRRVPWQILCTVTFVRLVVQRERSNLEFTELSTRNRFSSSDLRRITRTKGGREHILARFLLE